MNHKIDLKLKYQKTTFKLKDVEPSCIKDILNIANGKFGNDIASNVCIVAKLEDGRSEDVLTDKDLIDAIGLVKPNEKGKKTLTLKLKEGKTPAPKAEEVTPKPEKKAERKESDHLRHLEQHWNWTQKRSKPQYDAITHMGKEMHAKSDKVVCFTDGSYKLYTGSEKDVFDALLDNPDNMACVLYTYLWDPKKKTEQRTVLRVFADYSVQLWTDPETQLLGWGWIKPQCQTKLCIFLNLEDDENAETLKLWITEPLVEKVNQANGMKHYVWADDMTAFGIIPSEQFDVGMEADGIFFGRIRVRDHYRTFKGCVIHPSIHKVGELVGINPKNTEDTYLKFAKQKGCATAMKITNEDGVEICWKNWSKLTGEQRAELKGKAKMNAKKGACKYMGVEWDSERPFVA